MKIENDCFDHYIMVAPGSDYGVAMWSDLKKMENVIFLDYVVKPSNKLISILHHIHFSFSINQKIALPLQSLWSGFYSISRIKFERNQKYCLLFTDISACRTDSGYLRKLSKLPNITMVMVMVNVMASKKKLIMARIPFFHYVFSFDKTDCTKYHLYYYPAFYSRTEAKKPKTLTSDAFFVGASKGDRHKKIRILYERLKKRGGNPEFYLAGEKSEKDRLVGIHYDQWLSYRDVLGKVLSTNCLIEIMGEGQTGLTLRAMEAICYDKKLVTDNPAVKRLKFYSTGNILYTDNIAWADLDFICDRVPVSYNYQDEFSPVHFIAHFNGMVSEKQKKGAK